MDLSIEIKNTKIVISWEDTGADYYKVFCGRNGLLSECAQISGKTSIRLSLLSYGEH